MVLNIRGSTLQRNCLCFTHALTQPLGGFSVGLSLIVHVAVSVKRDSLTLSDHNNACHVRWCQSLHTHLEPSQHSLCPRRQTLITELHCKPYDELTTLSTRNESCMTSKFGFVNVKCMHKCKQINYRHVCTRVCTCGDCIQVMIIGFCMSVSASGVLPSTEPHCIFSCLHQP